MNQKLSTIEKKKLLKELKGLLKNAWKISNELIGEEGTRKNQDNLYQVRQELSNIQTSLMFVKY